MLIAIFGASCTGKTTLARALAHDTGLPARYCGDVVRAAAEALQVPLEGLPAAEHARIDAETLAWCSTQDVGIVEGRFLDQVLFPSAKPIVLVEVRADVAVRAPRWSMRLGHAQGTIDILGYDRDDDAFRLRAYGSQGCLTSCIILDTSTFTTDECLERLTAWLSEQKPD